eukprot:gene4560-14913_t
MKIIVLVALLVAVVSAFNADDKVVTDDWVKKVNAGA